MFFFRLCRRSKVKRKLRLVLSIFSFFSFHFFLNLMKACWSETFIPKSAPGSQSDFTALNVLDSGAVVSLDSDVVFNDDRAKLVSGCSGFEEGNQLPKGIMRSAVTLPCFFDVVQSNRLAGEQPCRMGRDSNHPSIHPSLLPSSM